MGKIIGQLRMSMKRCCTVAGGKDGPRGALAAGGSARNSSRGPFRSLLPLCLLISQHPHDSCLYEPTQPTKLTCSFWRHKIESGR